MFQDWTRSKVASNHQQPLLFGAVEPGWFSVLRMLWLQRQSCICTPWSASPGGPGSPACEAVEVSQEMIWMNFEVQSFAHFEFWCRSYVVCGDVRILQFGQEIWGVEIAALSARNTTLAAGAGACGAFLHSFLGGVEGTVAAKLQAPSSKLVVWVYIPEALLLQDHGFGFPLHLGGIWWYILTFQFATDNEQQTIPSKVNVFSLVISSWSRESWNPMKSLDLVRQRTSLRPGMFDSGVCQHSEFRDMHWVVPALAGWWLWRLNTPEANWEKQRDANENGMVGKWISFGMAHKCYVFFSGRECKWLDANMPRFLHFAFFLGISGMCVTCSPPAVWGLLRFLACSVRSFS